MSERIWNATTLSHGTSPIGGKPNSLSRGTALWCSDHERQLNREHGAALTIVCTDPSIRSRCVLTIARPRPVPPDSRERAANAVEALEHAPRSWQDARPSSATVGTTWPSSRRARAWFPLGNDDRVLDELRIASCSCWVSAENLAPGSICVTTLLCSIPGLGPRHGVEQIARQRLCSGVLTGFRRAGATDPS